MQDKERLAWLRLARTENVGPVTFRNLLARFGSATASLDALPQIRAQADLTDALVRAAFDIALRLHPLPNPTASERIAVLGYRHPDGPAIPPGD